MNAYHLLNGKPPRPLEKGESLPAKGLIWADFTHAQAAGWECWAEPLLGVPIDPEHVSDSHNVDHPSYFDGTADYDMLVFQGLGPRDDPFPLEARTAVFFIFERTLITVRATDNISIDATRQKLLDGRIRTPATPLMLAHAILDTMVDRYLRVRSLMDERFTRLQDALLDPSKAMSDWRELLACRREVRRLEALAESQAEALDSWRRNSRFDWTPKEEVRMRDLAEHVNRVMTHAAGQERDIEAAVQLHFAAMTHRTNRIVQGLTVLSAIFFPLTLITGIYGMNFQHMPELQWRYGYYLVLGVLVTLGGGLWWYFRKRHFL